MSNSYYNHTTYPTPNSPGSSAALRAELEAITDGFDLLPTLSGNGYKVAMVNAAGTALVATSSLQSLAITGSTIDSTPIGATTRAAGNFTTLSVNSTANLGSSVTIAGGTINNTIIGGTTPVAGYFTTLSATSGFTGNLSGNVTGNLTGNVTGNLTGNVTGNVTAASGTSSFNNVTISGTLDMDAGTTNTIINLAAPTNSGDAATKGYVDTADALKLNLSGGTMSGAIAMGTNKITGMGDPTSAQDAATKAYTDTGLALKLNLSGGTMSGAIAMGSNKITGLGTPTADGDAATKAYVDTVAQGLDVKASVRAATTANITLSGTQTIDGVAVIAGDRVLVKDQSTAANNGIYVAAAGAWSRSTDADAWAELPGAFVFVEDGTVNDNSGWVCTVAPGGTLGVTAITFEQFSGAGQINAGTGMTKSGNTLNVNTASSSRIVVGADEIDLATTGVTASTYRSVTVDQWGRVTGGTNPTTLAGYGITDAYTTTQVDTALALKLNLSGGTMSGAIAMGTNKITGLGTPTNTADAATKGYVDTADALKLNLSGGTMSGAIAMGTNKITGMGDPTSAQDAATKNYIDTIFGSTTSAAASAAAAAASAITAGNYATAASGSASSASTSASSALSYLDTFRGQYLGAQSSNPTVDGNGNALTAGDLYFNTSANEMRVYTGSTWLAAYLPTTGYLPLSGGTMTGTITFAAGQTIAGYLTTADAATTYQTLAGMSSYLTTATAASTYQTIAGMSSYLTTASASSTYLPLAGGTLTGNLSFSGTGRRITGDFSSNSTITDRVMFQSSTANGVTILSAIPNGTGNTARYLAYNSSDPTNAAAIGVSALSTDVRLASTVTGTGTALPMLFVMGTTEAARIDTSARVLVGFTSNQSGDKLQVSGTVWSNAGFTSYGTSGSVFTANANGIGSISAIFQNSGGNLYVGRDDSTGSTFGAAYAHVISGSGANPLVIRLNSAEAARFDSSGNLGLGTNSPGAKLDVAGDYKEGVVTANTGTAYTISLASGTVQILTLTGNCTFTFPTATTGRSFTLLLKQDATGSRTVTWPAAVKWPASTAPTITSTASKMDKFIFTADGTNWIGSNAGQNYL